MNFLNPFRSTVTVITQWSRTHLQWNVTQNQRLCARAFNSYVIMVLLYLLHGNGNCAFSSRLPGRGCLTSVACTDTCVYYQKLAHEDLKTSTLVLLDSNEGRAETPLRALPLLWNGSWWKPPRRETTYLWTVSIKLSPISQVRSRKQPTEEVSLPIIVLLFY